MGRFSLEPQKVIGFSRNSWRAAVILQGAALLAQPAVAAINLDGLELDGAFGGNAFVTDGGVGELFVSIIARDATNPLNDRSYARDLGVTTGSFVQGLLNGALAPVSFAPDAALTSFLGANAGKTLSFLVMGVHNSGVVDFNTFMTQNLGFLSTSSASADAVAAAQPQGTGGFQISGAEVEFRSFVQGVNQKTDGSPVGTVANNLSATFAPGEAGFHDLNFGRDRTFGFDAEVRLDGRAAPADFYFLNIDNADNSVTAPPRLMGTWHFYSSGELCFGCFPDYEPPPPEIVPLPPAAGLLGPPLLALLGFRRPRDADVIVDVPSPSSSTQRRPEPSREAFRKPYVTYS
jgi:hypothetical protein